MQQTFWPKFIFVFISKSRKHVDLPWTECSWTYNDLFILWPFNEFNLHCINCHHNHLAELVPFLTCIKSRFQSQLFSSETSHLFPASYVSEWKSIWTLHSLALLLCLTGVGSNYWRALFINLTVKVVHNWLVRVVFTGDRALFPLLYEHFLVWIWTRHYWDILLCVVQTTQISR